MATLVFEAIGALVDVLTPALDPIPVIEGGGYSDANWPDVVFVAHEGYDTDLQAPPAQVAEQRWVTTGGAADRDEDVVIRCALVCRAGASEIAPVRVRARDVMADIETALRDIDNRTLGVDGALWCEVSDIAVHYEQAGGALVRVLFGVRIRGRV